MASTETDKMIREATADSVEITSFVCEKNANVNAVEFVIQTEAIEPVRAAAVRPAEAERLTFWQKLLRLFAAY